MRRQRWRRPYTYYWDDDAWWRQRWWRPITQCICAVCMRYVYRVNNENCCFKIPICVVRGKIKWATLSHARQTNRINKESTAWNFSRICNKLWPWFIRTMCRVHDYAMPSAVCHNRKAYTYFHPNGCWIVGMSYRGFGIYRIICVAFVACCTRRVFVRLSRKPHACHFRFKHLRCRRVSSCVHSCIGRIGVNVVQPKHITFVGHKGQEHLAHIIMHFRVCLAHRAHILFSSACYRTDCVVLFCASTFNVGKGFAVCFVIGPCSVQRALHANQIQCILNGILDQPAAAVVASMAGSAVTV